MHETGKTERALLVMVQTDRESWPEESLVNEFKHLVTSTGIEVVDLVNFKARTISPSLFIGKGQADMLMVEIEEKCPDVLIVNNDLKPAQLRNLEDLLNIRVVDRTQLILDIFARHARTREGKLGVELAQLAYLLPRLKGKGTLLSRLGGGIGTRGPGETKLEMDRRKITGQIELLQSQIEQIKEQRHLLRKKRSRNDVGVCALVGYTSAGKSTLFNALTTADEKVSSDLFTTLDTVSREFIIGNNLKGLISDTVGFIYKLPKNLMDAFRATLEELRYADVLLHIVDAANPDIYRLKSSVEVVLKSLELEEKPVILIFNKIDMLAEHELAALKSKYPDAVFISALNKTNLEELIEAVKKNLFSDMLNVTVRVPFNRMDMANYLHDNTQVIKVDYHQKEVVFVLRADNEKVEYLKRQGLKVENQ